MRYFRIGIVVLFIASVIFASWANFEYNKGRNTDYPMIKNEVGTLEISVNDPENAIFRGLTATDGTDGDLTNQIMVASVSHFLEPGLVNVKYVVFDSHNNAASLSRRVRYVDYESPKYTLEKAPIYMVGSSFDVLDYLKVEDCLDGDITDRIRVISNMVNNYAEGVYPVILEVSNSCGDTAQMNLWVHYTRTDYNVNIGLHKYVVYHPQGEEFDPYQYIASVADKNMNPLNKEDIQIQGNLDVNKPGIYQLVYSYAEEKLAGKSAITVVITERQA